ncbi:MAG: TatD family hydrolase [Polyangiaceae bacterium]|nr:TatD family hydrolase [Polyangiaceae bacterium]
MLVDTHCHVEPSRFEEGPDEVLARARRAGVRGFMVVGVAETTRSAEDAVALAERHPDVVAAVGFHPHDAAAIDDAAWATIARLARHPRVAAVGETGLDYHYDHSPREVQLEAFRRSIALAREINKPVVVHTREAAADTLAVLRDEGAREVGGVIHCFSEDLAFAEAALELGFYLSFSGIVTVKNARAIQEVAAAAPLDRVLVETDAPYLAPAPHRGKRCEPAHVVHTAAFVARLRGVEADELARASTDNARRLLGPALSVGGAA